MRGDEIFAGQPLEPVGIDTRICAERSSERLTAHRTMANRGVAQRAQDLVSNAATQATAANGHDTSLADANSRGRGGVLIAEYGHRRPPNIQDLQQPQPFADMPKTDFGCRHRASSYSRLPACFEAMALGALF